VAPLVIKGVGDVDTEACPITTPAKDASGAPPSVRPAADTATYTNGGSGRASSACDVEDTTSRAAPATGAPDTPSSACSPVDTAIGCASPVDAVATPTPLTPSTGAATAGSWRVCRRRIFFRASRRRVPRPPTLQGTWRSVRGKNSLGQKDDKNS